MLLRAGARALYKTYPRVFLLAPPYIENLRAEKHCKSMLIRAMERVAYDTGAHVVPSVALAREEMWHDGIHLRPAGAKIIATAVSSAIRAPRAPTIILQRPRANSAVSSRSRQRALVAARQMGKEQFFTMSRDEVRSWAYKYRIPFRGARKEQEVREILAKIGVEWEVD